MLSNQFLRTDLVMTNMFKVAMKRLTSAKWGACGGQACVAVDYVLVEEQYASSLV